MTEAKPQVRTRDGAATRARIEREALRLFAERGVQGTSIRDISLAVGVADAALYRHFTSKDEIASHLFKAHYSALAEKIEAIGSTDAPAARVVADLVDLLCAACDDEPDMFAFVLLNQHAHLRFVPDRPNVVAALCDIIGRAQERGEIPRRNVELVAAMALGTVLQPAVFKLYGRLTAPMRALSPEITAAALAVLGVEN